MFWKRSRRAHLLLVFAAFGVSLAAALPEMLFGGKAVLCRDNAAQMLPLRQYLSERLAAGEMPLWFPFDGLGLPFVPVSLSRVFHPYTVFSIVLGPVEAMEASQVASFAIGFVGVFVLSRRLGAGVAAGIAGSAAFACSGSMLTALTSFEHLHFGAAAFPGFLASLDFAIRSERPRVGVAAAALHLGLCVLAGDPQGAYLFGLLGLPFAAVRGAARPVWVRLAMVALAGLGGLALAAVQLLPTLELMPELRRANPLLLAAVVDWSLPLAWLPGLLAGDLLRLGTGADNFGLAALFAEGGRVPWYLGVYAGALLIPFSLFSLLDGEQRRTRIYLVGAAAALLAAAMGGVLYRVLYEVLPLWSRFKYPGKLLTFATALLAVSMALGLTTALRRARSAQAAGVLGSAALLGAAAIIGYGQWNVGPEGAEYVNRLAAGLLRTSGLLLIATLLLTLPRWRPRAGPWAGATLVMLVVLDVSSVNRSIIGLCSGPQEMLLEESPLAMAMRSSAGEPMGHYRVVPAVTHRFTSGGQRCSDVGDLFGVASWERQALAPAYCALDGFEATTNYLPGDRERQISLFEEDEALWVVHWSRLFNGRFIIARMTELKEKGWNPDLIVHSFPSADLGIVRVPANLPRAFVTAPRWADGEQSARRALRDREVMSGAVAVVESRQSPPHPGEGGLTHPVPARIVSYEAERVEVGVDAPSPGVLVLNDAWAPGWKATLDGQPTPVLRANYLVRGVRVPSGQHQVIFTYPVPGSLRLGAAVSVLTLCILLFAVTAGRGRGRRSMARPPIHP